MHKFLALFLLLALFSCDEETIPKPKGYLRLEYPKHTYQKLSIKRPYSFLVAKKTVLKPLPQNWLTIYYPKLKASIDITYRPVTNNLKELLTEAQKLVFKHTAKADQIISNDFVNKEKKVFGSIYEITGNAASQIQFHATDSTHHFIKGALYFYAKPNYDSIIPAIDYLKKDMVKMMETLEWK